MPDNLLLLFTLLVFGAVLLLSQVLPIPTLGSAAREGRRIRRRLRQVSIDRPGGSISLVREKYLKELSPFEQWMDRLAGMDALDLMIEQSGRLFPAYRLVLGSLVLAVLCGITAWGILHEVRLAAAVGLLALAVPILKVARDRRKRLEKFEEQLPEALDIITRALKAGNPFLVALSYAAREMDAPLADEFSIVFDEINYGRDLDAAFHYLLLRVPSVSLMAMSTAILIQRETGGNLSEILDKISRLLRERFVFQREIGVLTAEGRLSAWVLCLMPLFVFGLIQWMNPNYYNELTSSPAGQRLLGVAVVLLLIGIVWISRLVRIEV
jgi:tight adherence protein B